MGIDFEMYGENIIRSKLSRFTEHIQNWKPLFGIFSDEFHDIMREQFASEGSHGGNAWQPLSPKYAAWKDKQGMGRSILVLRGDMYSSLVNANDRDAVNEIEEQEMKIGSKSKLAYWHHVGAGKLPERPIVKFSKEDNTRWVKIAHEWMFVELRKQGM